MSTRDRWTRAYRAARVAGSDYVCRLCVRNLPHGRAALAAVDSRMGGPIP